MKIVGVYRIRNLVTGRSYVGSSLQVEKRLKEHFYNLRRGRHHSAKLQASFGKHGEGSFVGELVEECQLSVLREREQAYLDAEESASQGYNICPVAGNCAGVKPSSETIALRVLKLRGRRNTPETLNRMRQAALGRVLTEETKRKLSVARVGKKHSAGAKHKVSLAQRGRVWSEKQREAVAAASRLRAQDPAWLALMRDAGKRGWETRRSRCAEHQS